jgi:hypothetical protein
MKIGFVVSFFDFRNDVRRVIEETAKQHEVIIFGKPEHREEILRHLPKGLTFRLIDEKQNNTWNNIWLRLYILLKQIPKSTRNFYLMEFFKASIPAELSQRTKMYSVLKWVKRLPKFISYDFYLNRLQYKSATDLSGIQQFVCFTAIADDFLMARLLRENHPTKVYVYSWDHPCKHVCFSKRASYLCWNEGIKQDVIELQRIPAYQTKVIGASQFGYYEEYRRTQADRPRTYAFDYVYVGCAIGVSELVLEEVKLVKRLAQLLEKIRPDFKVVVRPYPVQDNWKLYDDVRQLSNVVMDDGFRRLDLSVGEEHIHEKFEKISHAKAFFHLGTTMGLEACLSQTPSFIIDFGYKDKEILSLYSFIHQFQNERHLIDIAPQNAIKSEQELTEVLTNIESRFYLELNQKIQQSYTLKSFAEFANDLVNA